MERWQQNKSSSALLGSEEGILSTEAAKQLNLRYSEILLNKQKSLGEYRLTVVTVVMRPVQLYLK